MAPQPAAESSPALQAMRPLPAVSSDLNVLQCSAVKHTIKKPPIPAAIAVAPHCHTMKSQQWIERQPSQVC